MQKGPFGLMVHWSEATAPRPGEPALEDWNEKVDAFPVETFCDEIAATGAGWLIFPIGHSSSANGLYCSPNAVLEAVLPGHCSRRDLFKEIAEGITPRGMRMMAYLSSTGSGKPLQEALGWNDHPSDKRGFQKRFAAVVREWSEQMGPLISGWWFDGSYEGPRTDFTWDNGRYEGSGWGEAVRAGNPDSVYCLNPGANTFQYCLEDEGFLAGEANDLRVRPGRPLIGDKQWHALTWIDCFWQHTDPDKEIDAPRYFDPELHGYVNRCHQNGGAVTLNIGIYQDGTLAEASVAQVTRIAQWMKAGKKPEPVNRNRTRYSL
jgi:alpha-L-fucosidase